MPAIVIRASADAEPSPLRRGEILPDPDFSLLSPTTRGGHLDDFSPDLGFRSPIAAAR